MNKFNIYRQDRSSKNVGGGTCIFVDRDILSSNVLIDYGSFSDIETVACKLVFGRVCIAVICTYIAPNISLANFDRVMACLKILCSLDGPCVLIGDFNLGSINWIHNSVPLDGKSQGLFNFSVDAGLCQFSK